MLHLELAQILWHGFVLDSGIFIGIFGQDYNTSDIVVVELNYGPYKIKEINFDGI